MRRSTTLSFGPDEAEWFVRVIAELKAQGMYFEVRKDQFAIEVKIWLEDWT